LPKIYYSKTSDGSEVGRWSGNSIRINGTVTKDKQVYLGKVIDKEKLIFFSRNDGYFRFNPEDQKKESINDSEVPLFTPLLDHRLKKRNVIISFGGSYFLHQLINAIEYNIVLNTIALKNPDTMYALLQFYILSGCADNHALEWYQNYFTRFLYPRANMASQRISDFYVSFGSSNNRRAFFLKHIKYLVSATEDEYAILIDSTGCQNACKVPITKVSKHNNETNIEFRVVLVVQRATGLPVYYEIIPGNVVDSSTIARITRIMAQYGFRITQIFGDAGYSCPANLEKVILCGSDLVMRLNPAYDTYKNVVQEHWSEMMNPVYDKENDIQYRNRIIRVIKVPTVIGIDSNGEEVKGYVFLCRDMQAYHSKSDHYMTHHGKDCESTEKIFEACAQFGLFAIVTKEDHDKKDVIPYYYQRQGIEQFFDYAKNYCKLMPVRNHNMDTIQGHVLMSFIATFLVILIKNKMNLLDSPYIGIPQKLQDNLTQEDEKLTVEVQGETECVVAQEAFPSIAMASPSSLFFSLNFVCADVFENEEDGNNQIIPSVPYRAANDYFNAFGIPCPEAVIIREDGSLQIVLSPKKKLTCRKSKVFAVRPYASAEAIEKQKAKNTKKKKEKVKKPDGDSHESPKTEEKEHVEKEKTTTQGIVSVKRQSVRGRPIGSKDKKPRVRRWWKKPANLQSD